MINSNSFVIFFRLYYNEWINQKKKRKKNSGGLNMFIELTITLVHVVEPNIDFCSSIVK